jgi:hypothetical protein
MADNRLNHEPPAATAALGWRYHYRFDPHCRVPDVVRTVPHIAFAVDDLDEALEGREILIAPNEPSGGVRVAFILDDGAPVELLQFDEPELVRA